MPAFVDVSLKTGKNKDFKVILFSHGLGAHLNMYSNICGWFASKGFIVISVQHDNDHIFIDFSHIQKN